MGERAHLEYQIHQHHEEYAKASNRVEGRRNEERKWIYTQGKMKDETDFLARLKNGVRIAIYR